MPGRRTTVRQLSGTTRRAPVGADAEDSVALRLVVLAITMVSLAAVVAGGALDPATTALSLLLVPVGSWVSYRRRRAGNGVLKVVLAGGLIAALLGFLVLVGRAASADEARSDLGSLFVWVQVLHTFDVPRRRDLAFSVAASVALMAQAATLALDSGFALLLAPFVILVGVWLFLSDRSRARDEADGGAGTARGVPGTPPGGATQRGATRRRTAMRAASVRAAAVPLLVVTLASATAFLFTPRLPGGRIIAPPFSLVDRVAVPGFSGGVVNPDFPGGSSADRGAARGAGYPGFGTQVDLRVRGELSDRLIMRVRSPQAAFWRGQAFDTFDGTTWTVSSRAVSEVGRAYGQAIPMPPPEPSVAPSNTVVQTYFVVRRQPNVVFAASRPREVYFPESLLAVDTYGSIRSPILLEPQTVYSVVSDVPVTTASMLRAAPAEPAGELLEQYTQLPPTVPRRVIDLAGDITEGRRTAYDKAMAVQRWLRANTRYRLDIPPDPPGVDAVDHFLFVRREGFCEHLASAMIILLRASGVPARLAVGFDAGERNAFTGYFEVRESDAHAWVEVHYPGVGWVEYDPTHGVPVGQGSGFRLPAKEFFAAVGRFLAWAVPDPVERAAGRVGRTALSLAGAAVRWWPATAAVAVLGAVALMALRRRRHRLRHPPPTGAAAAFASMCRTFERRGHPRPPGRTPSEHLQTLLSADALSPQARADLERIVRTFERERFAPLEVPQRDVEDATAAAARLRRLPTS